MVIPRDPPVSGSQTPSAGVPGHSVLTSIFCGSWHPNSDSHACPASTLTIEASLSPAHSPTFQGGVSSLSFVALCQASTSLPSVELQLNLSCIGKSLGMAELWPFHVALGCSLLSILQCTQSGGWLSSPAALGFCNDLPGTELQHGSFCFLLESIFCPTFISYCAFLWGLHGFVRQKRGFLSGRCSWLLFSCVFV